MIPGRDYGQPPPGGMVYTLKQTADFAAAAKARRMAAALNDYASARQYAALAKSPGSVETWRAEGRAALHIHPELLGILEPPEPSALCPVDAARRARDRGDITTGEYERVVRDAVDNPPSIRRP